MLKVIKDVNLSTKSLCSNNIVTLWHVACLIYFTLVIDLGFNRDSFCFDIGSSKSIDIFTIILIISSVL